MFSSFRWNRYVWSELAGPTALGMLLWNFLLLMNAFFLVAETALSKNLGWGLTTKMFVLQIPSILVMTIPMAALFATMIAVGRMSADHEWVALQSAGHGPGKLMRPVLVYGLLGSLLSLFVYFVVVPHANYAARTIRGQMIFASNLASDLRPGVFYDQVRNVVMFVDNIGSGESKKLEGVMVHLRRQGSSGAELILARHGDLVPLPDGSGKLELHLHDGVLYAYDERDTDGYQIVDFDRQVRQLDAATMLTQLLEPDQNRVVTDMTAGELLEERRTAYAQNADNHLMREARIRTVEIEFHRRIALPMASLLFCILAVPLGIIRARSGKGAGFALSIVVILVYYVVFTVMIKQATTGRIPPWLGPWAASFVIIPWAAYAHWRLHQAVGGRSWTDRVRAIFARRSPSTQPVPTAHPAPSGPLPQPDAELEVASDPLAAIAGTPRRFFRRMDSYVSLQYLRMTGFSLVVAYLITAIVETKRLVDGVMKNDLGWDILLSYLAYALPSMLNLVLPIACLIGGMVAITVLTRTGELTAIKSSGVSMRRVTLPVLFLTLLVCGGMFLVRDKAELPIKLPWSEDPVTVGWAIVPTTSRKAAELKDMILDRTPISRMTAGGRWAFGTGGSRLYHYRLFDPGKRIFQGLSVFELDRSGSRPRIVEHHQSDTAQYVPDLAAAVGGETSNWKLQGGWYRTFPEQGIGVNEAGPDRTLELDAPANFERSESRSMGGSGDLDEHLTLAQLQEQIGALETNGYDTTRLRVAYFGKFAQPLTPLVMVLLGLPFAFRVGRRGSLYGLGVAILLVIVYWATFAIFNALGLETLLPPLLAALAPNVLFGLIGIYLLLYVPS
ncbi:hypothetical protein ABI59_03490 [Acidobacteria bacterium Mor1]|nr:hypothetical protein ABI59_03490 [Acidobacteria bacterium Mor1]